MTDEDFIASLAQYQDEPEVVEATLVDTYGDLDNVPPEIVESLNQAGFELAYDEDEPEYAYEDDASALEEYAARMDNIEAYLQQQAAAQPAYEQPYEWQPTQEEAEAILVDHLNNEMDALEQEMGRELTEGEIARTTQSVLDIANSSGEIPSIDDAYEAGKWDHEERTDSHAGRVEEMSAQIEAQNYEPPPQEHIDELAERGDHRSRVELMGHALDGTVSLNGDTEAEPWGED
jgi:hypothetical protein